jgi:hypothetical protein
MDPVSMSAAPEPAPSVEDRKFERLIETRRAVRARACVRRPRRPFIAPSPLAI